MSKWTLAFLAVGTLLSLTTPMSAQSFLCEDQFPMVAPSPECVEPGVKIGPAISLLPLPTDPLQLRLTRYSAVAAKHRLCGLASFYSASLDGTLTANGERYRMHKLTAAHLTLPLGTWVEVSSRATGKSLRLRVNDRGPYVDKFMLDLSYAAAHALGVDDAEDRHVDVQIIGLPGEEPLPEDFVRSIASLDESSTSTQTAR